MTTPTEATVKKQNPAQKQAAVQGEGDYSEDPTSPRAPVRTSTDKP